jgi:molybdopterin-biosynthesis enzyme MoeA-like protein
MLPGVPHEMRNLLTHEVLPGSPRGQAAEWCARGGTDVGVPESSLAEKLDGVEVILLRSRSPTCPESMALI